MRFLKNGGPIISPNHLFWRVFLGRANFGNRPYQSPSHFGMRLYIVRPHFSSPNIHLTNLLTIHRRETFSLHTYKILPVNFLGFLQGNLAGNLEWNLVASFRTLVATIHFSPFTGEWFTDFLFSHRFFLQQEEARVVHSHIFAWQSQANASLIHSIHAKIFTPFTRIVATKFQESPRTEPQLETGTVGTVFQETETLSIKFVYFCWGSLVFG